MATAMADPPQGDGNSPTSPSLTSEQVSSRAGNMVYKSGLLSLSSKGIGWTSWKKRWFILTRTSLVFFKNDPSAPPRGGEVNLTLGGIDLNNSGSVVVKEDKKLLTVLFPDGRDGRAFTLKAETLEDLYEWKTALEEALAQAPSATIVLGQNGIFKTDQTDVDGSFEHENDGQFVKPLVTGRPILLALEDADGTPSFLEKALRFMEEYGVKVEGILRQAADVDDVEHRVREYEQGKTEFSPEEDPHIIGDCIKHVLRELPSSPVPASCCKALLEACRTDRGGRVAAMRDAICESFPEPNRRLLQRVLMMMQSVASHKAENRMSSSAVAACMAPLLLRPLLAGDCELENDFDVGGDGSVQLLQAAAAANHAQTIVITLLEEYSMIFGEGSISSDLYSDSDLSQSASEEDLTDDGDEEEDEYDEDSFIGDELDGGESFDGNEQDKSTNDLDFEVDSEQASTGPCTESGDSEEHLQNDEGLESSKSCLDCTKVSDGYATETAISSSSPYKSSPRHTKSDLSIHERDCSIVEAVDKHNELPTCTPAKEILSSKLGSQSPLCVKKSTSISNGPSWNVRRPSVWSRIPVQKKLSMDSIEYALDDEVEIQRLEELKVDLKNRIAEEAERNTLLQEALWTRKKELHDRRLVLEQEVARLQEELQQERDLRMTLEAGLKLPEGPLSISDTIDEKIKADLSEFIQTGEDVINLKKKFDELELQLNQQRGQNHCSASEPRSEPQKSLNYRAKLWSKKKETEASVSHPEKATKNKAYKNPLLEGSEDKNEKVEESKNSANKRSTPDQQSTSRSSNFKLPSFLTTPTSEPAAARLHSSTNSKKTWIKNEGVNPSNTAISTSSAPTSVFSRFTTRFNFLNERRTQIANEIQNMDKGRGSAQSTQNPDKNRHAALECPYIPGPDRARCHNKQPINSEIEGGSIKSPEKHRKSDGSQPSRTLEKTRRSDASSTHGLERGRSEGQHFWDNELGQGLESQFPPRTNSR